jgi:UDP-sugar transporter A1/2/3
MNLNTSNSTSTTTTTIGIHDNHNSTPNPTSNTTTNDLDFIIFNRRVAKKWVSLILLVFQTTFLVLIIKYSRIQSSSGSGSNSNNGPYLISTVIVMSEVLKVIISISGIWFQSNSTKETFTSILTELRSLDTLRIAIPGLLYLIQNNLLFIALSNLEAAVYQVTYQLKIMTTALFSVTMLGKKLSRTEVASLFILTLGVALVQLAESSTNNSSNNNKLSNDQDALLGLMCLLIACVSSGFAGVYLERIMKQKNGRIVSLFMRNIQLGIFGVIFGLVTVFGNSKDRNVVLSSNGGGFFQGYNNIVLVVIIMQAAGGLLIAAVMKYADNILKGFATSVSIVLSSLISMWLFQFQLTTQFVFGAVLVILAVMMYSRPSTTPVVKSNNTKV